MTPLYSVADIRHIEQSAQQFGSLMQHAGRCAADAALALLPQDVTSSHVLVLAGPGNNGGDALEACHFLAQVGVSVTVWLAADPDRYSDDAKNALVRAQNSHVTFLSSPAEDIMTADSWSLVIDGLFGIGLIRPIEGRLRKIVEVVNQLHCPILALDVPSGLNADTGAIVGDHGTAIHATHTITFIGDKAGLHTCDGRDVAGKVQLASLDIAGNDMPAAHAWLNEPELFAACFTPRAQNSHKGSYGDVAIVGGAAGMNGAPVLAARAAAHAGAGRVYIAFIDDALAYISEAPELMCRRANDLDFSSMAVVIGPGMGNSISARDLLFDTLSNPKPIVIDADALNLLAQTPQLQKQIAARCAPTIITPHPLEAARLLNISVHEIQTNRILAARTLARQFNAVTILKGSGTVIAQPNGDIVINPTGNPALATAGTGDVLAGVCGALLAQGFPAWEAALAAVWLHGYAADTLVDQHVGPIGLTASELIPAIRVQLNRIAMLPTHFLPVALPKS